MGDPSTGQAGMWAQGVRDERCDDCVRLGAAYCDNCSAAVFAAGAVKPQPDPGWPSDERFDRLLHAIDNLRGYRVNEQKPYLAHVESVFQQACEIARAVSPPRTEGDMANIESSESASTNSSYRAEGPRLRVPTCGQIAAALFEVDFPEVAGGWDGALRNQKARYRHRADAVLALLDAEPDRKIQS